MLRLIKEIKFLIENKKYYSALALTLTLPDICIHSKFLSGRNNYIKWVDDNIFYKDSLFCFAKFYNNNITEVGTRKEEYEYESKHLLPNESLYKADSINGNILYALRCSFLHAGNVNINFGKNPINIKMSFIAIKEDIESYYRIGITNKKQIYMVIDIKSFCNLICKRIEEYYYKNIKDFENLLNIENIEEDEMPFYIFDKHLT